MTSEVMAAVRPRHGNRAVGRHAVGSVAAVSLHIHRVLVRGRFADLDDAARDRLLAEADDHTVAASGFTESGVLTYDRTLGAFGFRIQVRTRGDDAEAEAEASATAERAARAALDRFGAGCGELRTSAGDMAAVWQRPSGAQRG